MSVVEPRLASIRQTQNHRALGTLLGLGECGADEPSFIARRIRDSLCPLRQATLAALSHVIVRHGKALYGLGRGGC